MVLICRVVDGLPYPTVKVARGYKNGTVIEAKNQFDIATVKESDEGLYWCIGENDAGRSVLNITLTVLGNFL